MKRAKRVLKVISRLAIEKEKLHCGGKEGTIRNVQEQTLTYKGGSYRQRKPLMNRKQKTDVRTDLQLTDMQGDRLVQKTQTRISQRGHTDRQTIGE